MKFIGRQSELRTLEQEYRRDGGFVVIYGRRRVGKTRLIKEFIKDKPAVYFLATEEVEAQSMKRMAGVIARATGNALLGNVTFSDWADLFRAVATYQPDQKKVIVLDEFPYMVKTNPAFPSILQNIWDEFLQDSNVMLILSGSLIGMMKKHALSYDSPLYGRRTAQIRLMPLPFTLRSGCPAICADRRCAEISGVLYRAGTADRSDPLDRAVQKRISIRGAKLPAAR